MKFTSSTITYFIMKKGILQILLLLSLLTGNLSCQKATSCTELTYFQQSENRKIYDSVQDKISDGLSEEAIILLDGYKCQGIMCRFKNYLLAKCYSQLKNDDLALYFLSESFSQGHTLEYTDTILFINILEDIKIKVDSLEKVYFMSINTSLRQEILTLCREDQNARIGLKNNSHIKKKDQFIQSKFREIVSKYGWPGIKVMGYTHSVDKRPHILAIHANLEDKIFYLSTSYEVSLNGEDDWWAPRGIFIDILFSHTSEERIFALPYLYIENNKVDVKKSLFVLESLAEALKFNSHYRADIFWLKHEKDVNLDEIMNSFAQFLKDRNVSASQLSIFTDTGGDTIFPENSTSLIGIKISPK